MGSVRTGDRRFDNYFLQIPRGRGGEEWREGGREGWVREGGGREVGRGTEREGWR